jgi:hypothetical protein
MKHTFTLVRTDEVPVWYPRVRRMLLEAADRGLSGGISEFDLLENLKSGHWQLGLVAAGADIVASYVFVFREEGEGGEYRVLSIDLLGGGDAMQWIDEGVTFWRQVGAHLKATHLRLVGRRGWDRLMRSRRFKCKQITLEREL